MKKVSALILLISVFFVNAGSIQNWHSFTNTTHLFDLEVLENQLVIGTWGGLLYFDKNTDSFTKTLTTAEGLSNNSIQAVSYNESTGTLYLGTKGGGVVRVQGDEVLSPLNETLGLPSNNVKIIEQDDEYLFVVTNHGLSVFRDDPVFPFPLMIYHFNEQNVLLSNTINDVKVIQGKLYIATNEGLNVVDINHISNQLYWRNYLTNYNIVSIYLFSNKFVAGTESGLLVIDDISVFFDDESEYLLYNADEHPDMVKSNSIGRVLYDENNNIWFSYGTWSETHQTFLNPTGTSISKLKPSGDSIHWGVENSNLTTGLISGIFKKDGLVILSSWGEGMFFYENGVFRQVISSSLVSNKVTDMAVDHNQVLWVVTGTLAGADPRAVGVGSYDGYDWNSYKAQTTPLRNNNVSTVSVDMNNRKWFGTWEYGMSVFDDEHGIWTNMTSANYLQTNLIGGSYADETGNVWVSCFGFSSPSFNPGSIMIMDQNFDLIHTFEIPNFTHYNDVTKIYRGGDKLFIGTFYSGLRIWEGDNFPQESTLNWSNAPFSQLQNVRISDIDGRNLGNGEEVWIASENGLFKYNSRENRWYRHLVNIKQQVYVNNTWDNDFQQLYFQNEERLFSAIPTTPTALFVDPFDRVWIGSVHAGISMYNPETNRFTNFNTKNSPLLSDYITSFAYEPYSGMLYIGTTEGLNSLEIGKQFKEDTKLKAVIAYPNPFYPGKGDVLTVRHKDASNFPVGINYLYIYDLNGRLVRKLEEDQFFQFSWDGKNEAGSECGSGIYYYVVSTEKGKAERGTIVLIR